jgi:hypothetical protein
LIKQYMFNVIDAFSVFLSAILGGGKRMSMSQRLGEVNKFGGPKFWQMLRLFVDWLFLVLCKEKNHCYNSIYGPSTSKELYDMTHGRKGDFTPGTVARDTYDTRAH